MNGCPSAATLARLGLDSLHDETLSTIEEHIAGCSACQSALNRLVRNDAAGSEPMAPALPPRGARPRLPGFVIEGELGRGSMGVVYLARQPSLGRLVALKVVASGPAAGSREYARWLREGRSCSLLRHENVVRLYDVGESDGWLYLVLEYIPGGTLDDRLDVPYAPRDAARLMAAIADAVEAIHGAGLLHLDLKPSNILMDAPADAPRERANPRVGDFGLAYLRDDPDAPSNTVNPAGPIGTPRYMAPEQAGGDRDRLGPTADVHGLGALLYHAITGRPPFAAASVAETLEQVRNQEPVPPRRLNPTIPRDLETICLKCLRKEPSHRYATARAVADDLRRFLDGEAIAARPASMFERTWRWCRRRPAVAALAAALVSAIAVGFLGMFLLWRHAEAHRARAEDDSRRALLLLGQLIELNVGRGEGPKVVRPAEMIELIRLTRQNLIELADRMPDREAMYSQRMAVDLRLTRALCDEARWDEVGALFEVSLRDAEAALRLFPDAGFPRTWLCRCLQGLAELAERRGRPEEGEPLRMRILQHARAWYEEAPGPISLSGLVASRSVLAQAMGTRGRVDEARALLQESHRSLAALPDDWLTESLAAQRISVPLLFRQLGMDPPPYPAVDGPLATIAVLASQEADRLADDAWADLAARALLFDDRSRPAGYRESVAGYFFASWMSGLAHDQRNQRQLDRARRTAGRAVAFARLLVERHPEDPTTHLVLAEALEQIGKNAWRVDDRDTVRVALRRSIEANLRAVDLNPYDEMAHHLLDRRRQKLGGLGPPRP